MKKLTVLFFLSALVFFGCSDQSSILDPVQESSTTNWINLTSGSLAKSSNSVQDVDIELVSKWIDAEKGGSIRFNYKEDGLKISGKLKIKKNSASQDELPITIGVAGTDIVFGPTMDFAPAANFSITFKGVDLSGIDEENVKFVYIDTGGVTQVVDCRKIIVNKGRGMIGVVGAKITHFSRYGFTR